MIIVMLGAPGSGKGTIAKLLSSYLNIEHISTGDMFRETIKKGKELGEKLEYYMSQGKLVPDDIVIKILEERLLRPSAQNGVVLDGFPRTKAQAEYLDELLKMQGKKVDVAIELKIDDDALVYRTVKRRMCSNKECRAIYNLEFSKPKIPGICDICGSELYQRDDDNEETIKARLKTYHKKTEDLIKFYEDKGKLFEIDLKIEDKVNSEDIKEWMNKINIK